MSGPTGPGYSSTWPGSGRLGHRVPLGRSLRRGGVRRAADTSPVWSRPRARPSMRRLDNLVSVSTDASSAKEMSTGTASASAIRAGTTSPPKPITASAATRRAPAGELIHSRALVASSTTSSAPAARRDPSWPHANGLGRRHGTTGAVQKCLSTLQLRFRPRKNPSRHRPGGPSCPSVPEPSFAYLGQQSHNVSTQRHGRWAAAGKHSRQPRKGRNTGRTPQGERLN